MPRIDFAGKVHGYRLTRAGRMWASLRFADDETRPALERDIERGNFIRDAEHASPDEIHTALGRVPHKRALAIIAALGRYKDALATWRDRGSPKWDSTLSAEHPACWDAIWPDEEPHS